MHGLRIEVRGVVQGVGFRPWVYRLAREKGILGHVRNDATGVTIEAFARACALREFVSRLRSSPPPAAEIRAMTVCEIDEEQPAGFSIASSRGGGERVVSIPPDLATCDACVAEIFDPDNRRYRYPFTNCTDCGPRFSIAVDVPYDRPATTMAAFRMCTDCRREYESAADRRFHAQPNACPACGPHLALVTPGGSVLEAGDPVKTAAAALLGGRIVAIKGIGGFHLACDATSESDVLRLRGRKRRDEKPFAVMARDLTMARELAILSDDEIALLTSVERPIVLVPARQGSPIAAAIAPRNRLVGLMLPYTPLHHLLLADAGRPLVMTSGNLADEPIAHRNDEALDRLRGIADLFLMHDRNIESRADDSVTRIIAGAPVVLRRSRGFTPRGLTTARTFAAPILACGAHLKNTFALAWSNRIVCGPHIGDLENPDTLASYTDAITRMERFLGIRPEIVAHDLHPAYLSTEYALSRKEPVKIGVQHHHAHVASVMAEHGVDGHVLGLAWDGTGYGADGSTWGSELLLADDAGFERLATFRPIALAGGDKAIREVWRIALALLDDAYDGDPPLGILPLFCGSGVPSDPEIRVVRQMIRAGLNTADAHGAGRLFDAFGAIFLGRPVSRFEGQIALEWNLAADEGEAGAYPFALDRGTKPWTVDFRPMLRAAVDGFTRGDAAGTISARFHNTLAHAASELIRGAAASAEKLPVVLSGGCFQNALLTERIARLLGTDFTVLTNRRVPPGDGGIAFGQALVAEAAVRKGRIAREGQSDAISAGAAAGGGA